MEMADELTGGFEEGEALEVGEAGAPGDGALVPLLDP